MYFPESTVPLFIPYVDEDYFTLDFSNNKDQHDPLNHIALTIIYSAFLTGNGIRFSRRDVFTKQGAGSSFFVGELAIFDLKTTSVQERAFFREITSEFFSSTNTPFYLGFAQNYWFIPHASDSCFMDLLINYPDIDFKLRMVENYVNMLALDDIMQGDSFWDNFFRNYIDNDGEMTEQLLIQFVNSLITFKDPGTIYTILLPIGPEGTWQQIDPNQYDIDVRFSQALKFNRFLS